MFRKLEVQASAALMALIAWIFVGTTVYRYLEDWTWNEAFYFAVVTLSTVGYGDLHPTTPASRTFTALFILSGVAVVLAALGIIGSGALNRHADRIMHRRESKSGEDD